MCFLLWLGGSGFEHDVCPVARNRHLQGFPEDVDCVGNRERRQRYADRDSDFSGSAASDGQNELQELGPPLPGGSGGQGCTWAKKLVHIILLLLDGARAPGLGRLW